uniref:Uncharacterized protein n=1 Tax=Anopheles coluzzii TaxID=1518534 RepID=A0A8W7P4Q0_ANOCL
MLIELSNFSDKLRQYRLILEKLTANQPDYERRREKLSPWLPGSTMKLTPGAGITLLIGIAGSIFLVAQSHRLLRR